MREHRDGVVSLLAELCTQLVLLFPKTLDSLDGCARFLGKRDRFTKFRFIPLLDVATKSFPDPATRLINGPPLGVTARYSLYGGHPPSFLVALICHLESHLLSHRFPRQGSKSHSIFRSSP